MHDKNAAADVVNKPVFYFLFFLVGQPTFYYVTVTESTDGFTTQWRGLGLRIVLSGVPSLNGLFGIGHERSLQE